MVDELEEEYSAFAAANNDVETMQRDPMDMPVRQLKQVLDANSIDHSDYYEKVRFGAVYTSWIQVKRGKLNV